MNYLAALQAGEVVHLGGCFDRPGPGNPDGFDRLRLWNAALDENARRHCAGSAQSCSAMQHQIFISCKDAVDSS